MIPPEFSRLVRLDSIGEAGRAMTLEADAAERAALARRFGLPGIARLTAEAALAPNGSDIAVRGTLAATVTQSCVATGAPVEAEIEAGFAILFRPHADLKAGEEEIELGGDELDTVFYDGPAVDIGEAVAETLALSLDPYPRAPGAEEALRAAGVKSEEQAGPFSALAGLRDKLGK